MSKTVLGGGLGGRRFGGFGRFGGRLARGGVGRSGRRGGTVGLVFLPLFFFFFLFPGDFLVTFGGLFLLVLILLKNVCELNHWGDLGFSLVL